MREYVGAPRILTGVGLWLGVVAALVLAVVGCVAVLATVVGGDPVISGVLGCLGIAVALAGGGVAALRGRDLIRAGGRLSRAAEAWMTSGPSPTAGLAHQVHGLLSALRPEIFPRVIFCSLSGLAAVLAACAVGYSVWQLTEGTPDVAINVLLGASFALLAVVCAVPAVALWRGRGASSAGSSTTRPPGRRSLLGRVRPWRGPVAPGSRARPARREVSGERRHQPRVPASPLKGPTTRSVHQPP